MSAATYQAGSMICAGAALEIAERGLRVIPLHSVQGGVCTCQPWRDKNGKGPCPTSGKHPRFRNWQERATSEANAIERWFRHQYPESNLGIATGAASRIFVLDVDPKNGGDESLRSLIQTHGPLPDTLQAITGGGGRHFYFAHPGGTVPNEVCILPGLDIRGDGGQVVAAPSIHASGRRYEWDGLDGFDVPILPAPAWLLDLIVPKKGAGKEARQIPQMIPDGEKHRTCVSLAGSMRRRGCNSEEIYAALLKLAERFETQVPLENLRAIAEDVAGRYAPATSSSARATAAETEAPEFSEDALAVRFTRRYADDLRYVAAWGRWLQWNGRRWAQDDTLHVFDRAREICRAASAECTEKPPIGARVASAATVAAIERLVRADRRHAAVVSQWDADPWLLNTPGGMVDLRTGKIEAHRRDAYCTKVAAVTPGGACPLWDAFLARVTGCDGELQAFLRRMVGYCLTADTREQALFFLYGTGANGKSVFLSTVAGILNDYAKSAAIETFVASASEQHPTDLAGLQGARLVTATETEDGRRWAESKLKTLTGGDRIAARFMRQDFFEFTPVFKLVIAGNHKPGLRSVDEAIRRRLHLVPFTVTIPKAERDLSLSHKLRVEWGGILGWALTGCLEWQAKGLNPPASVRNATEAYMAAEDGFAQWLDARCVRLPNAVGTVERLFTDWKTWADAAGEYVGSQKRFSQSLEERGFKRIRDTRGARAFQGIGLRTSDAGGDA